MLKIWLSLVLSLSLFASDYDKGIEFYNAKEYKKAVKYFIKAGNNGDLESAYIMGYLYTGGIGVKGDLKKSLQWYEKSAKGGHINAQINLGFMYIAGHGTKVDYNKASIWIGKAKAQGSQKAKLMWEEFKLDTYKKQK